MDAIQLPVACFTKCDLFLTNDKQLRQFKELKCITVDELEELTTHQRKELHLSGGAIFNSLNYCE